MAVVQGKDAVRVSARRVGVVALLSACLVLVGCASAKTTSGSRARPRRRELPVRRRVPRLHRRPSSGWFMPRAGSSRAIWPRTTGSLLTLTGVPDHVTRFADRPLRAATVRNHRGLHPPVAEVVRGPSPNAVLSYLVPGTTRPQSIVVTLDTPVYDAAAER